MKYRFLTLLGLLALTSGAVLQAQDYDDIYYDASKPKTTTTKAKVTTNAKTVAVYGEVPENYKVAAQSNYRVERDEDEYNRRGIYEPSYEVDLNGDTVYTVDLNGDTIFEEAFANTRRIERFYNPDIVILSDDEDLVELYYDESPTINLVIGSDWGYSTFWNYGSYWDSYYPWYTGWYSPWYTGWYRPYYAYWGWGWYSPRWYGPSLWGWNYWGVRPWSTWHYSNWYGWNGGIRPHHNHNGGHVRPGISSGGHRVGLANNRNGRSRVDATTSGRNGIGARGANGNRPTGVGTSNNRGGNRGGYATGRGGNMGSRGSSGVSTRNAGVSRGAASSSGSRSYNGGSRSYSGSSSSGSSRSYSGGSSSSSRSSGGGSYSGGSRGGSSGGGSHGGSSGGGGRRR